MSGEPTKSQWYYVGHYGQLGPLTLEQMGELVRDGVIGPDTYVWRTGMDDWATAPHCSELQPFGLGAAGDNSPPPLVVPSRPTYQPMVAPSASSVAPWQGTPILSDRNRTLGGVLNLIPGVGRIYLAYPAIGVLQLLTTIFCGVGAIWAFVDAIYILSGGLKYDGYGRQFGDS